MKKGGSLVLLGAMLCLFCPEMLNSAAGKKKRRITYPFSKKDILDEQQIVWRRKSSLPTDVFLQALQLDAEHIPYDLPRFDRRNIWEYKESLALAYRLIALSLDIPYWFGFGYAFFSAGDNKDLLRPEKDQTDIYKIHFMPHEDHILDFAYNLAKYIQSDHDLSNRIVEYKFLVKMNVQDDLPRTVVYCIGKENAQIVLNRLYAAFKNYSDAGKKPRFSAYVTDLIWVTQGNGDDKLNQDRMHDYEQPDLIYYKKDISGEDQDYYLKHPVTGEDLVSPNRPKA